MYVPVISMRIMCKKMKTIISYCLQLICLSIWKTYFMIIALFEFGVGQISRKYGPHKSSQLGLELPSWLDMDYSHQFRYWQVYFKLSVAQALHTYMLAYLVLDAVSRASAFEVGMEHKKEFPLKWYKSCSELSLLKLVFISKSLWKKTTTAFDEKSLDIKTPSVGWKKSYPW